MTKAWIADQGRIARRPEPSLEPVRPIQLYEQIAARILENVRGGLWKPSDKLPSERELAQALGVSRPSVREAISALQISGIIQTRAGSGSFVAKDALSAATDYRLAELVIERPGISPVAFLDAREPLDAAIASLAASRPQRDPVAEKLLADMALTDLADSFGRAAWNEADRLFHQAIARMSGNLLFIDIYESVTKVLEQPLWRSLRDAVLTEKQKVEPYVQHHKDIYRAIVEGDREAASFFAGHHVRQVRRDMGLDEEAEEQMEKKEEES